MIKKLFPAILTIVAISACHTPQNIQYFQDTTYKSEVEMQAEQCFRLRPEDKINIVVSSKDPYLEALFTLTASGQRNVLGASSTPQTVAGKTNSGGY